MSRIVLALIPTLALASAAAAHPGHGEAGAGTSLAHHLTEPMHVAGAFVALLAIATTCTLVARRRSAQAAKVRRR